MHCYNYSNAIEHAGTGRRHACYCTLYGTSSTATSSPLEDVPVNHYASTLEVAPSLPPSVTSLLSSVHEAVKRFKHRARCNAMNGARFAKTGVISTELYAVPPHVAK
jgi:hypothetical protein